MAVKSAVASTLNPNAPLFVPAAYLATEDFSPEWWRLVQNCPAFRDFWIRERFECMDDGELTAEDLDELEAIEEFVEQQVEEMLELDNNKQQEQDVSLDSKQQPQQVQQQQAQPQQVQQQQQPQQLEEQRPASRVVI